MTRTPRRRKPVSEQPALPWQTPTIPNADIFALQALEHGTANAAQQKRAVVFLERVLCATDRMSFYPGGEDGRRRRRQMRPALGQIDADATEAAALAPDRLKVDAEGLEEAMAAPGQHRRLVVEHNAAPLDQRVALLPSKA